MNTKIQRTMNRSLKHVAIGVLSFAFTASLLMSCRKKDTPEPAPPTPVTPPTPTSRFKPADFKITLIATQILSYGLEVDYEEVNTTSMAYDNDTDGSFRIKWSVKTTDGVQYQEDRLLETELDAGAAAPLSCVIGVTAGKTIDPSTLIYSVYYDN